MGVTLKDIAVKAGVSRMAVSAVVDGTTLGDLVVRYHAKHCGSCNQ